MYQVTIEWEGSEIGYGEGESAEYARQEAIESVDSIYASTQNEWTYVWARS